MIDRRQFLVSSAAAAALGPAVSTAALAQAAWPSKPISIVILFAAGSGTDTMARIFAEKLSAQLGQPVTVDNKPGANGTIARCRRGACRARRPHADVHLEHFARGGRGAGEERALRPGEGFRDHRASSAWSRSASSPIPAAPFNTIQELVAYAKANLGKLSYGTGNSTGVVAGETLKRMLGFDAVQVPYKSVPPALNDVLSGTLQYMVADIGTVLPARQGRVA